MTTLLLDTHVLHWWSAEPGRLSRAASDVIEAPDVLAVAAISWFELAWLARNGRVVTTVPVRSWLDRLAEHVVTLPIDPATAAAAVGLARKRAGVRTPASATTRVGVRLHLELGMMWCPTEFQDL